MQNEIRRSIVDKSLDQNAPGPISCATIKLPLSAKHLSDRPEETARGLAQINNELVKLIAAQLIETPFEGLFSSAEILQTKAIRAFQRELNNEQKDERSMSSALENIERFGVEVNLYDYFETWVSFGEIMLLWAIPNSSEVETFLLVFDDSHRIFRSDIDCGVDIGHIVNSGTSLRNLLLSRNCGVIRIKWEDDSANPKYANYDVISYEESLLSEANQLIGFVSNIIEHGKVLPDEEIQWTAKFFGLDFLNVQDVLKALEEVIGKLLHIENPTSKLKSKLRVLNDVVSFFSGEES